MHTKKTLLFHDNEPWHKSKTPHLFDVAMGSYDGAETCELIGLYLLSKVKDMFNNEVGLYRDDGLAILRNQSQSQVNRIAKKLIAIFKQLDLRSQLTKALKLLTSSMSHSTLTTAHIALTPNRTMSQITYIRTRTIHKIS